MKTQKRQILAVVGLSLLLLDANRAIAQSEDLSAFPQLKVSLPAHRVSPQSQIRIKIFPHERDYKPHGLDREKQKLSLQSNGLCRVFRGEENRPAKTKVAMFASREIALDLKALLHPLWIECDQPATVVRESHLPHYQYAGNFYARKVQRGGEKQIELINVVSVRDYLKGVVPSEVYPDWPIETLKTQAVAARTYAIFHLIYSRRHAPRRFWDVDDTIAFQAYTGLSLRSARTDQAVRATQGQILTHHGSVIQAYYHADSAGRTESAWNVWRSDIPYVAPVQEFFADQQAPSSWNRDISLRALTRQLLASNVLKSNESLTGISVPVIGRTESGRVRLVTLLLNDGSFRNVSTQTIRRAIGSLPSTLFSFEADKANPDRVWMRGQGSGHGVGMSQRGAAFLAQAESWTYDRILDFYYLDTRLCRLTRQGELPDCYELAKQFEAERVAAQAQPRSAS